MSSRRFLQGDDNLQEVIADVTRELIEEHSLIKLKEVELLRVLAYRAMTELELDAGVFKLCQNILDRTKDL